MFFTICIQQCVLHFRPFDIFKKLKKYPPLCNKPHADRLHVLVIIIYERYEDGQYCTITFNEFTFLFGIFIDCLRHISVQ